METSVHRLLACAGPLPLRVPQLHWRAGVARGAHSVSYEAAGDVDVCIVARALDAHVAVAAVGSLAACGATVFYPVDLGFGAFGVFDAYRAVGSYAFDALSFVLAGFEVFDAATFDAIIVAHA